MSEPLPTDRSPEQVTVDTDRCNYFRQRGRPVDSPRPETSILFQWEDIDFTDDDFSECGVAFEREHPETFQTGCVGVADSKLLAQQLLVVAAEWFETNRE
jgi:hypothetical protein